MVTGSSSQGRPRLPLTATRNILKAVGGTTDDIMSIRYYFKTGYMEEGLAALRDLGSDYFKSPYPSTTCVEVVRVAWADHLLEIESVAILGGQTE